MIGSITGGSLSGSVRLFGVATAGAVFMGLLLAAPAAANDGDVLIELSRDGIHFTAGRVENVFGATSGYIPGETRPGTVWVRNASREAAQLSLAVANTDRTAGSLLPAYLQLQVATATRNANVGALPAAGGCSPVIENWTLSDGESVRLDLNLTFAVQAPRETRNLVSSFDLIFLLQGSDGGQPVSPCADALYPLAAGVSVGRSQITNGSSQGAQFTNMEPGTAGGTILPDTATDFGAIPLPPLVPLAMVPGPDLPHSNVVATSRSPWPWLLTLSAATYTMTQLRKRRRTQ